MLDLLTIKTLLVFARRPLAIFAQLAFWCIVAAAALSLIVHDDTGLVVEMAVIGLFASLSIFLFMLGLIAAVTFQAGGQAGGQAGARRAPPGMRGSPRFTSSR